MKCVSFITHITPQKHLSAFRTACATKSLTLLLLTLPAVGQAELTWTTNNSKITITGHYGIDGAVIIPSTITGLPVTSIGDAAFENDTILTNITIPSGVTSIGDDAFDYCTSLTSVTIPNSVTHMGGAAFFECYSLTSVVIGNNVTSIGMEAFYGCHNLTNVTIPNSVTYIGFEAFLNCTRLTSVTIGSSVTRIWYEAFGYCPNLRGVYFKGNAPSLDPNVFVGDNNATVYYLPGTTNWYTPFGGRPTALWFLPNPLILNNSTGFGVQTNGFGFTISWATNIPVVVEACTKLANPVWSPVRTNTLTNGSAHFSDPQWTNYPNRLYRLRSP